MTSPHGKEKSGWEKLTTAADRDWKARCRIEEVTKQAWRGKFGWILDEYK